MGEEEEQPNLREKMKGYRGRLGSIGGESWTFGCNPAYLCSIPGFLRLINICLGIICLGLWLPGYAHDFRGERISPITGDTEFGDGNGWKREPLNQFVLAAIIICLGSSILFFFALICVKSASVDWNRFNKISHLMLSIFLFITSFCSIFGCWYFNENCCHVRMEWEGVGMNFIVGGGEFFYARHCYCYFTRYLNTGQNGGETQKETILFDATKGLPDLTGFDHQSSFSAHHMDPHLAAIVRQFVT